MKQVLFNGRLYTVFEKAPVVLVENPADFHRDERRRQAANFKNMARHNYRKR